MKSTHGNGPKSKQSSTFINNMFNTPNKLQRYAILLVMSSVT